MKTTKVIQGAFTTLIEPNAGPDPEPEDYPYQWVLLLHDEVLEMGWSQSHDSAILESDQVVQEFVEAELLSWNGS